MIANWRKCLWLFNLQFEICIFQFAIKKTCAQISTQKLYSSFPCSAWERTSPTLRVPTTAANITPPNYLSPYSRIALLRTHVPLYSVLRTQHPFTLNQMFRFQHPSYHSHSSYPHPLSGHRIAVGRGFD